MAGAGPALEVVVVGSANLDLVVSLEALPRPGETVTAVASRLLPGGKGANQATAAARLGRRVGFVGRRGDDDAGRRLVEALTGEGVDVSGFEELPHVGTGQAVVMVDEAGENSIVVLPGANALLGAENPHDRSVIASAAVVVAQLEVPLAAVAAAAAASRGLFVLNAAPARPVPAELLRGVDVLVVNETEFETVLGCPVPTPDGPAPATLAACPARAVVVTLGEAGALVWDGTTLTPVPALRVVPVDTTGAGDTFVGALADALSRGLALVPAATWAVAAASLSTRALGATAGMPTADEVAAALEPRHLG